MSWFERLYETYDNCSKFIGVKLDKAPPLLPIAHTTQNAHIEITIRDDGTFSGAEIITKSKVEDEIGREITIIPCTEDSNSRAGKAEFPHPLCDKLQYVAGDYIKYGGTKGPDSHQKYLAQLKAWCDSPHSCTEIQAIYAYLSKGTVISDLISCGLMQCKEDGTVKGRWPDGIDLNVEPLEAFVRFIVHVPGEPLHKVWQSPAVWQSYVDYLLDSQSEKSLCYVTGAVIPCSDKHPAKLRHIGDKAKLISANDTSGYTFRGRFTDDEQTVRVGFLPSQKAHAALRWLISRQGMRNDEQSIVIWGTKNESFPIILKDSADLLNESDAQQEYEDDFPDIMPDARFELPETEDDLARRINSCMSGYWKSFNNEQSTAVIMAVEAATVGRLSITYYRELTGSRYLEKLINWHTSCAWLHTYKREFDSTEESSKKGKARVVTFYGAPAPMQIAEAAYGKNCSDKLKKATVERLMPCIIDGKPLPYDIVQSVVRRASRCTEIDDYSWEKALSIACALVKKYRLDKSNNKEEWSMGVDNSQLNRSYLYGRLLAVAQEIESWALYESDAKRETTAERMMHQFSKTPYKTWANIRKNLSPYLKRLGDKAEGLDDLLNQISDLLSFEDYTSTEPLEDVWLLGYSSQRKVFIDQRKERMAAAKEKKLKADSVDNK